MSVKSDAEKLAILHALLRKVFAARASNFDDQAAIFLSLGGDPAKVPAKEPKILTLDEPTTTDPIGFDTEEQQMQWEAILGKLCY